MPHLLVISVSYGFEAVRDDDIGLSQLLHLLYVWTICIFEAVGVAMRLALELCRFPQATMRGDRRAAYYSTYDAKSWADALKYEYECGMENLGDAVSGKQKKNLG